MLKLVESDNITVISPASLRDIAKSARAFADAVEAGDIDVERCVLVVIRDGDIDYTAWGDPPSIVEAIGMLEMASRLLTE